MKLTKLKLKRMEKGYTQEYVSTLLGCSRSYLAQMENEYAVVDGTMLIKLAQVYDCKTVDLI